MAIETAPDVPLFLGGTLPAPAWELAIGIAPPPPAQEYAPGAWVPQPHRAPDASERARYTTSTPPEDRSFVAVVPLDTTACATLRTYYHDAQRGKLDDAVGIDALKRVLISASRHLEIRKSVETRQPNVDTPRQVTVTRRTVMQRHRRIGLHQDTWTIEGDPRNAPNRLALNLGPGTRWLLYVPHSVMQLRRVAGLVAPAAASELLPRFRDDLPVLRVAVPPDHAYVAPTELVLHDASTLGTEQPALKQHMLGWFHVRR